MTESRKSADRTPDAEPDDLSGMRALENALGDLSTEARVPDHLWSGIRERMAVPDVAIVPIRSHGRRSPGRRFSLSIGQMAAAGVVLAFLSGGSVWMALAGSGTSDLTDGGGAEAPAGVALAAAEGGGLSTTTMQDYRTAVSELEAVLAEGRTLLGQETLHTIEESLATIDQALDEAVAALAGDPGSELLNRLVTRNMRKKIEILRQTAVVIRARST